MNILAVFAHPNPESFNHAILATVVKTFKAKGHSVVVRDLYGMRFDPVLAPADLEAAGRGSARLDVAEEQKHIREANLLVFIHPIWWSAAPAILKGWIDRVFANGFAFRIDPKEITGLLAGKKAAWFCTAGATEAVMDKGLRAAMETIFVSGNLRACGLEPVLTRFFYAVDQATEPERIAMLHQAKTDAETIAPKA
jgi:NAD(P)H dehydrogenase (quinone)